MPDTEVRTPAVNSKSPPDADDTNWRNRGACSFYGPTLFFGWDGEPTGDRTAENSARKLSAAHAQCSYPAAPSHYAPAKNSASGAAPPNENAEPFATPRLLDASRVSNPHCHVPGVARCVRFRRRLHRSLARATECSRPLTMAIQKWGARSAAGECGGSSRAPGSRVFRAEGIGGALTPRCPLAGVGRVQPVRPLLRGHHIGIVGRSRR